MICGLTAAAVAATSLAAITFVITPYANKKSIPFECTIGSGFEYDLDKIEKVDPKLVTFRETDKIQVSVKEPIGLAVDRAGTMYVTGESTLLIMRAGGISLETRIPKNASSIAAGGDGTVYIGFTDHIRTYDRNGKQQSSWQSLGPDAYIASIALNGNMVFAADSGNRRIIKYDSDGRVSGEIVKKEKGMNENGFVVPSTFFDIAVSEDGKLWAANPGKHSIEVFDSDGNLSASWNREANFDVTDFVGCCNPTHIAAIPDGLVTCEKGVTRVKIYTRDGKLESVVAAPDAFERGTVVSDVAVDRNSRVLVLDPKASAVRVFERIVPISNL